MKTATKEKALRKLRENAGRGKPSADKNEMRCEGRDTDVNA